MINHEKIPKKAKNHENHENHEVWEACNYLGSVYIISK